MIDSLLLPQIILAKITILNAELVKLLGFKSVIALLSFSNFGTSEHPNAKKVSKAVSYLHKKHPEIDVDGPLQSDFALNREMLKNRFPFSILNGRKAVSYTHLTLPTKRIV